MSRIYGIGILFFFSMASCSNEKDKVIITDSLASLIAKTSVKLDAVIACASSAKEDENTTITYFYPRPGTSDFRYYQTVDSKVDKNDFNNYKRVSITPENIFNGYLKKFTKESTKEKWVVITFSKNDTIYLSTPIRLMHRTKPTEFSSEVIVKKDVPDMPIFTWSDGIYDDTIIYFQVISDDQNDLISGTYTSEKSFQFYNLDNVILNITRKKPAPLNPQNTYFFTGMGVNEDNWVNLLLERSF